MSLPFTSTNTHHDTPLDVDDASRRRWHMILLLFEASIATLFFGNMLTIATNTVYSRHGVPPPHGMLYIAGVSIPALAISLYTSGRSNQLCILIWRVAFHAPFYFVAYGALSLVPEQGKSIFAPHEDLPNNDFVSRTHHLRSYGHLSCNN